MTKLSPRIQAIEDHLDQQAEIYQQRTVGSLRQLRLGAGRMPLGVASNFQSHYPYPFVVERGEGQYVYDLDGHRYLDMHSGFGSNIYGHAHPLIVHAISETAARGTHYAAPDRHLATFADELCERIGMEQVRLCNSGTEATMNAIRVARAHTGRDGVIKIEGCYHGHHDVALVSVKPALEDAGPRESPHAVPACAGVPADTTRHVHVVPFNDLAALERACQLAPACLIVEPVLCNLGLVTPDPGYLQGARELCDRYGIVLIFDQVKTGVTIAAGGAEEVFDVTPDLHCLGKAIGGGVPVGAFGGGRDLMAHVASGKVLTDGTFSGNPLVTAAGLAALTEVLTPSAYQHLDRIAERLVVGAQEIISEFGLPCHARALGAKGGIFFSERPARDYRDWKMITDGRLAQLCWLWMANHGIWMAPGSDEQWTLPVQITEQDADDLLDAFRGFAQLTATLPAE